MKIPTLFTTKILPAIILLALLWTYYSFFEYPLHAASRNGYNRIVRLLLACGAKVNLVDDDGAAPLMYAIYFGHKSTVELLIQHGADVNQAKIMANENAKYGATPLFNACYKGHHDIALLLLEHGAQIDAEMDSGTALHFLSSSCSETEMAELLIQKGANVNAVRTDDGCTPLHVACWYGNTDYVQLLLQHGADVHAKDCEGNTPLHLACLADSGLIVAYLIDHGAIPDAITNEPYNQTPLTFAARAGSLACIQILVKHGAQTHIKSKAGSLLHQAATQNKADLIKYLVNQGLAINEQNEDGMTPLHIAFWYGNVSSAQALIMLGADTTLKTNEGKTAIDLAQEK